ncbi:MAG: hypothetical protein NC548_59300 [Lachnospiraceae bacterium]|nr:hypothetical protein [Lachnospiraceae bacterium]
MRANLSLIALMLIVNPLTASAEGVAQFADRIDGIQNYISNAHFEVLLPQAQDPVTYELVLQSSPAEKPDTLAPCQYLITWVTESHGSELKGFSAYFDGNAYRLRNNKLQEYHYSQNPEPFSTSAMGVKGGVQQQAQFSEYLPQFIAQRLREMAEDTSYRYHFHPDTIVGGKRRIVVDGDKETMGYASSEFEYVFDHATGLPVSVSLVNSPGAISEQLVDVTYSPSDSKPIEMSEDALIANWPEEFELYRQDTFRSENLAGKPLPSYSCQYLDGQGRAEHMSGGKLDRPAIIAVVDPEVSTAGETIEEVRAAAEILPQSVDVVWAFSDNNAAAASELLGKIQPGETALISARSIVRNCGITLFPTIMLIGSDGIVADVIPGYNNQLGEIVIQKASLLR